MEKNIKTRIQHKHDTEANWNKATGFIPKIGELIVYDADGTYSYPRFKVGDGITSVVNLAFANEQVLSTQAIYGTNPYENENEYSFNESLDMHMTGTNVTAILNGSIQLYYAGYDGENEIGYFTGIYKGEYYELSYNNHADKGTLTKRKLAFATE